MIYTGHRRSGKTTELIKLSHVTNYPIVCLTSMQKEEIERRAKQLGLSIPKPITTYDLPIRGIACDKVLVDELDIVLNKLIGRPVHASTTTDITQHLNHEMSVPDRSEKWFRVIEESSFYYGLEGKEIRILEDGVILDIIVPELLGGLHRVYLPYKQLIKIL